MKLTDFMCHRCVVNRIRHKNVTIEQKVRQFNETMAEGGEAPVYLCEEAYDKVRRDGSFWLGLSCFASSVSGACEPNSGEDCELEQATFAILNK